MKVVLLLLCVVLVAAKKYSIVHPNMDIIEKAEKEARSLESRIVGGSDAIISNYKHQAALLKNGNFKCGATIIAPKFLLTAAHCVDPSAPQSFSVRAGSQDRTNGGQVRNVKAITRHTSYDTNTYANNIAVVELTTDLDFNGQVGSINIGTYGTGDSCTITGWGFTSYPGSSPVILKEASVSVISKTECEKDFGSQYVNSNICVKASSVSACNGDSGGPLTCTNNGGQYLAGTAAFGKLACTGGSPSVYTRASLYQDWINQITN